MRRRNALVVVRPLLLAAAPLLFALPGSARAGNDDELLVGSRAAMTAGAVSATVMDGSSTWYNPGGLGAIERDQVDVSGTVYTLRFYSAPGFLSLESGEEDDGSVVEFLSVPNQIAFVRRLGHGVSLGLGYFVPRASNFIIREQLRVGDDEDGSRWRLAVTLADVQHTAAAALGFALSPRARIGFSLIGTYEAATESLSLASVVRADGQVERLLASASLATLQRIGGELGAGVQIDLTRALHLAVTARSPRVLFHDALDVGFADAMAVRSDGGDPLLQAELGEADSPGGGPRLLLAGRVGVGLAYAYGEASWVAFEIDLQPGLHEPDARVQRRALLNARLGVYHELEPGLAVGAGLFTDRAPDEPSADPITGGGDFYGGTLGVELNSAHRLARDEPTGSLEFSTMFAIRYAFSDGTVNGLVGDPAAPDGNWVRPREGALRVHEVGFYVGSGLRF
jgi:hypothetical protein